MLETIARYDFPELKGKTGIHPYEKEKSSFCSRKTALNALEQMISKAQFKHIILSYSTDGIMKIDDFKEIMQTYGEPDTYEITYIPYRRFKSNDNNNKEELKEILIYIQKEVH